MSSYASMSLRDDARLSKAVRGTGGNDLPAMLNVDSIAYALCGGGRRQSCAVKNRSEKCHVTVHV